MALALRAPWDLDIALAALGPRPGVQQACIANIKDIYLRTRRTFSPLGCPMLSGSPQRFPVPPHLFGMY
jgi:hypothetical protein